MGSLARGSATRPLDDDDREREKEKHAAFPTEILTNEDHDQMRALRPKKYRFIRAIVDSEDERQASQTSQTSSTDSDDSDREQDEPPLWADAIQKFLLAEGPVIVATRSAEENLNTFFASLSPEEEDQVMTVIDTETCRNSLDKISGLA